MTIKCNKDLLFCDGSISFTKNKTYKVITSNNWEKTITEKTKVLNNQNEPHSLGFWHKHFKIVKQ